MQEFFIGGDETGQVVLFVMTDDGRAVPVSRQNGTWAAWVNLTARSGHDPGALLPVTFPVPIGK